MAKRHSPPNFLPPAQKKVWEARYDQALKDAKVNYSNDEKAQATAANKAANAMLVVTPPETAEHIDKLPEWQIVGKRSNKLIDGVEHRTVVTIDGRKYAHPVAAKK